MASFIDQVEEVKRVWLQSHEAYAEDAGEFLRIAATAQTYAETASMWAVKAATRP